MIVGLVIGKRETSLNKLNHINKHPLSTNDPGVSECSHGIREIETSLFQLPIRGPTSKLI